MSKHYLIGLFIFILSLYSYQTDLSKNDFPIIELTLCVILVSLQKISIAYFKNIKNTLFIPASYMKTIFFSVIIGALLIVKPIFFVFLPVFYLSLELKHKTSYLYFILIPIFALVVNASFYQFLFVLGQALIASLIYTFYINNLQIEKNSYREIDHLRYINEQSKDEQEKLIKLQDNLIANSILNERRRIVGEIHDILGHQLSSAIIQIAALEFKVADPLLKKELQAVKNTLDTSMNNVRSVIHLEKEKSIDLKSEIQFLVDQFNKCKINFSYMNKVTFSNHASHSILSIFKEALTNINKHSNATQVNLSVQESNHYVTLLIADNGKNLTKKRFDQGIGLITMEERVQKLGGRLHITTNDGFRIFIKLPKELKNEINDS
ncbi:sensor histidine kinase [Facklamia sp. 7083-14-GEN3]|uniref:sensor histidine kinase n=1 Tax=Facklamia sp. 7083-14-GEN3 TaxID=2973478 RepID=UPI00215CBFAA|nr:histidine kinase [Facklamia sp. 7083-14-GEN3]MCR8968612.1 histidine kinase [Facklamia sp. 7083-14-GEN3]